MPLSAPIVASIIAAVIESSTQSATTTTQTPLTYESYVLKHTLPPEAKLGIMAPPAGNGRLTVDGVEYILSPVAQFRNTQNLIIQPMTIQENKNIIYVNDRLGAIYRVWLVSQADYSALR